MFVELLEEPLRPFVILRRAGDGFALPVEHRAHAAHLLTHVFDVGVGPLPGVDVACDGGIFSGQPKSIETHGEEHIVATHAHPAGAGVRGRHGEPVSDMQFAGWIRQHGHGVVLGFAPVDAGAVELAFFPLALPFDFDFVWLISFGHRFSLFLLQLIWTVGQR